MQLNLFIQRPDLLSKKIFASDLKAIEQWIKKMVARSGIKREPEDYVQDGLTLFIELIKKHDFNKSDYAPEWFEREFCRRIKKSKTRNVLRRSDLLEDEKTDGNLTDIDERLNMIGKQLTDQEKEFMNIMLDCSRDEVCKRMKITQYEYDMMSLSIKKKIGLSLFGGK